MFAINRMFRVVTPFENFEEKLETLTIITDNGPVLINAVDYDPAKHTLPDTLPTPPIVPEPTPVPQAAAEPDPAPPVADPAPPVADPAPPVIPVSPGLMQEGAKWFIVDMNRDNEKIGDPKGYPSRRKAEEAVATVNAA